MSVEEAMDTLREAFKEDPMYAHSWHCNVAMSFHDATGNMPREISLKVSNEGASRFMKLAFDVETSQDFGNEIQKK